MSKREIAARVLGLPALAALRGQGGALRILAYHRIVAPPWDDFAFDEELISATPTDFEAQMRFARRNFEVCSFADLDACDRAGRPWPRRALIVTFDDGYRDNFTEALPVLKALDLPATIFLATGHIGQSKLFWWDLIAFCFKRTALKSVAIPAVRDAPFELQSGSLRRAAIDAVLTWAKATSEGERSALLENSPALLEVRVPADVARGMHLSWDEVRKMNAQGIEFGSHTVTHPILSRVNPDQLRAEACESKAHLERELGQPVLAFAYPAGTRQRRDTNAERVVQVCGYRFAVVYDQGVTAHPDRALLPRLHVDRDQSLALFRANLLFPRVMLRS